MKNSGYPDNGCILFVPGHAAQESGRLKFFMTLTHTLHIKEFFHKLKKTEYEYNFREEKSSRYSI